MLENDVKDLEMENSFLKEQNQTLENEIKEIREQLTKV